jgi:hypothetical protein
MRGVRERNADRQAGRQANLKEISSRKLPSYAKHTKNLGLQPPTVPRKQEPGTRNPAIMSAQMENQMKKKV